MKDDDQIEDFSLGNIIMTDSRCLDGVLAIILIAVIAIGQGLVDATETDRNVGILIGAITIFGGGYAVRRRSRKIQRILTTGERARAKVTGYAKGYKNSYERVTLQFERDGQTQELTLSAGKAGGEDDYPQGKEITIAFPSEQPDFIAQASHRGMSLA